MAAGELAVLSLGCTWLILISEACRGLSVRPGFFPESGFARVHGLSAPPFFWFGESGPHCTRPEQHARAGRGEQARVRSLSRRLALRPVFGLLLSGAPTYMLCPDPSCVIRCLPSSFTALATLTSLLL